MKRPAPAPRSRTLSAVSKKLARATFARSLQVAPCYPESTRSIHLH